MPPELGDPGLEGHSGPCRRPLEDERDRPLCEGVGTERSGFQLARALNHRPELLRAELGADEKVARQDRQCTLR